jgi:hypothetical protein
MSSRKIFSLCLLLAQAINSVAVASEQELLDLATGCDQKTTVLRESDPLVINIEETPSNLIEDRPAVVIYDAPPIRSSCNQDGFFCSEQGKSLVISFSIIAVMYGITYGILRLVS